MSFSEMNRSKLARKAEGKGGAAGQLLRQATYAKQALQMRGQQAAHAPAAEDLGERQVQIDNLQRVAEGGPTKVGVAQGGRLVLGGALRPLRGLGAARELRVEALEDHFQEEEHE